MESRTYKFNESTLTVKFGNIIETQAEIIVSSDDCYVSMGGGRAGVSGAIYQAGGESIMRDARKMVPVPLGDVIVTTAGNMRYQKYVFHCITIDKKRSMDIVSKKVTEDDVLNYLLQHAVDKCFQLMLAMDMTSIAFPTIGAGSAKIPILKVIDQMSEAIARNLSRTNKRLNVELYWYDIYSLCSASDIITLFESLAAKAALVGYQHCSESEPDGPILSENTLVEIPIRENMHHKVFISYSRRDKEMAEHLCNILRDNGIEYWIDKEGIYSSSNYKELIVDAIEMSKAVLFISSANSNASNNVINEVSYAVRVDKPILPLMLDDAPYAKILRLDLSNIDQIDFKNPVASSKKLITSLMYVLNK